MSKIPVAGNVPTYAHAGDAGADLCASEQVLVPRGGRALVPTGVKLALPDNTVAMVCTRSGMAHKAGVIVTNAPGIIDSGYRGELFVNLYNTSTHDYRVMPGDRVAQLVIVPFITAEFVPVDDVADDTERGTGGHGSSGQ